MNPLVIVKANGTDISSSVYWESLDVLFVLTKEVSTCKFNVRGVIGSSKYSPAIGDTIDVYETYNSVQSHIFGGTITEIETTVAGGILPNIAVTATDWSFKMNGKLVVKSYVNQDPHAIVADIINSYCPGYTYANTHYAGYTIPSIKFNYEPVTKCLEALAKQIGWDWYVDPSKDVHFFLSENIPAPYNIDDTSGNLEWPTLDVDLNLANIKNSVFVIGGTYPSTFNAGTTPDVFLGNSNQNVFITRFKYTQATITVTLNGSVQTVGLANSDNPASFQVLWDSNNNSITFSSTPGAYVIKVYGTAQIPIIGHAINGASIATWGEFQDVIFDSQIKSIAEAQQRAAADILQFGDQVHDIKFTTLKPGLRIGQTINVVSTVLGVTLTGLVVKRIEGTGYSPFQLEYQVEVLGSDNVTFVDLMSSILQQQNANNTQTDSTVLEVLLSDIETLASSDVLHAPTAKTTQAYQWTSGAQPGKWGLSTWA